MSAPKNCDSCRLHLNRRNIVNGQGKWFEPKLFIVGDAPGREDDDTGEPFKGGVGRVLSQLLSNAGVARSDCFITNTVRCRPPNNRVPELDELYACQGHLRGELDKIKPALVVALGETAATLLTGKNLNWRGSIVDGIGPATGYKVLITHHPSFVMRMRAMFPVVSWDLRKAFSELPEYDEQYIVNCGYDQVAELLADWKANNYATAVDIETHGSEDDESKAALNPWAETFSIIGISLTPKGGVALHLNGRYLIQAWDLIKEFLESHSNLIYQNNLFDRTALIVNKGIRSGIAWDTLDGMVLIHSGLPKKLDFQRSLYTNMPPYKEVYKIGGKYQPGRLSQEDLARLNCLDTDATWRIAEQQAKFVSAEQMASFLEEDTIAIDMRVRGVFVDKNKVAAHYSVILPKLEELRSKYEQKYGVSISSPAQLNKLLYDQLGFPKYDDTGKSTINRGSTNEKAIQAIAGACGLLYVNDEDGERFDGEHAHKEILSDILEYRGLAKIASTYCEGVFKNLDSVSLLHPQWLPSGTDTGRWSCQGTPMQGFPKEMRDVVIARPGKIFLGADYKGMQILAAAILAGDLELAEKMLDPDYSLHNEVLEAIKPHYPSIKKIQAKTVVFGTFFGRTPRSIAQAFHVPVKTAELWQEIFYSTRPKLKDLFEDRLPKFWEVHGYAEGIYGRRKYCEMVTEAKNHPVQNFEAEIVKAALKKLVAAGFTPVLQVHDQLVCEEDDLGDGGNEARYQEFASIMETVKPELFHRFPVEGTYAYNWKLL